jgi:hypothetical protein
VQTTGLPPTHVPAWQVSPVVQALPSEQAVPSGLLTLWQTGWPLIGVQTLSSQGSLDGGQLNTVPPPQTPAVQVVPFVQGLPSSHGAPSAFVVYAHCPVAALQTPEPATWHGPGDSQITSVPEVQTPSWQVSVSVQALPSEQGAPFGLGVVEHRPVRGSHVPGTWHGSSAEQTTGLEPTQIPA